MKQDEQNVERKLREFFAAEINNPSLVVHNLVFFVVLS